MFCMIAYMPKATVQAAIGGIPLAMGLSCGRAGSDSSSGSDSCDCSSAWPSDGTDVSEIVEQVGYILAGKLLY